MTILFSILILACIIGFFYGSFLLVFKKGKRKFGSKIAGAALFAFFAFAMIIGAIEGRKLQEQEAITAGFASNAELQAAKGYGITDSAIWNSEKDKLIAAKAESERLEKEEAQAKLAAEKAAKAEAERLAKEEAETKLAAEKAEKRRKGFHCLSGWDGSLPNFKRDVKNSMREPDSFEHIETLVTPVDGDGMHTVKMRYRAKNGFGGMNVATAIGKYANDGCQHVVILIE